MYEVGNDYSLGLGLNDESSIKDPVNQNDSINFNINEEAFNFIPNFQDSFSTTFNNKKVIFTAHINM